jgi:mediator of RNA polymerase II transcription subunit 16
MAWSKNGCLAYIAPGSKSVNLRVFSRDSSTGEWGLATDKPIDIPPGHNDYPFVHISWSHLGNDLAIVNSAGHVMVFSCAMVLDRMSMATLRLEHGATDQDSDRVIGMHWLAILPHQQRV